MRELNKIKKKEDYNRRIGYNSGLDFVTYNLKKFKNKKQLCLQLNTFGLIVILDLMMHWQSFLLLIMREST